MKDGNPEILEPNGPVEVCVRLQDGVTTDVDFEVTFTPQTKLGSARPATRMFITVLRRAQCTLYSTIHRDQRFRFIPIYSDLVMANYKNVYQVICFKPEIDQIFCILHPLMYSTTLFVRAQSELFY